MDIFNRKRVFAIFAIIKSWNARFKDDRSQLTQVKRQFKC